MAGGKWKNTACHIHVNDNFFEDMENKSRKNIQIFKYWKL